MNYNVIDKNHSIAIHSSYLDFREYFPRGRYKYFLNHNNRITFSEELNYFVESCVFRDKSNGAIRLVNEYQKKLYVLDCKFFNNYSPNDGGSIYFSNGECVQKRLYSEFSKNNDDYGGFSFAECTDAANKKNYMFCCSIVYTTGYIHAVDLDFGEICFSNNNITHTYSRQNSIMVLFEPYTKAYMNYSTFDNSSCKYDGSIYLASYTKGNIKTHYVKYCCVLNNAASLNHHDRSQKFAVITHANTYLTIGECVFINNSGIALFSSVDESNIGIHGYIHISNCCFSENRVTYTSYNIRDFRITENNDNLCKLLRLGILNFCPTSPSSSPKYFDLVRTLRMGRKRR